MSTVCIPTSKKYVKITHRLVLVRPLHTLLPKVILIMKKTTIKTFNKRSLVSNTTGEAIELYQVLTNCDEPMVDFAILQSATSSWNADYSLLNDLD